MAEVGIKEKDGKIVAVCPYCDDFEKECDDINEARSRLRPHINFCDAAPEGANESPSEFVVIDPALKNDNSNSSSSSDKGGEEEGDGEKSDDRSSSSQNTSSGGGFDYLKIGKILAGLALIYTVATSFVSADSDGSETVEKSEDKSDSDGSESDGSDSEFRMIE